MFYNLSNSRFFWVRMTLLWGHSSLILVWLKNVMFVIIVCTLSLHSPTLHSFRARVCHSLVPQISKSNENVVLLFYKVKAISNSVFSHVFIMLQKRSNTYYQTCFIQCILVINLDQCNQVSFRLSSVLYDFVIIFLILDCILLSLK